MKHSLCYSIVVLCLMATPVFTDETISGKAKVIDGDTIDVNGERIRLHGIDAPETRQICQKDGKPYPCGKEATATLSQKVKDRKVTCKGHGTDKYGRTIATCTAGKTDLGQSQVRQGEALAYRKYSKDYVGEEKKAKTEHLGIWKTTFEKPWDQRHKRKNTASTSSNGKSVTVRGYYRRDGTYVHAHERHR